MFNSRFTSLSDLRKAFPTEQSCIDYLEERRWHGNVISPFDKTSKVYKCKDNKKSATFVFVIKMLSYYEQTIETFLLVTLPDIISGYFGHDTGETEK